MNLLSRLAGARVSGGWTGWLAFALVFATAAAVVSSGPAFVEAVGDDVAARAVTRATTQDRSVQLQADALIAELTGERFATADAAVQRQFAAVGGLEAGPVTYAIGGTRTSTSSASATLGGFVRIVARDGALDALDAVAGGGTGGVWVSQRVADVLDIGPGDVVEVGDPAFRLELPVAAVYRDLDLTDFGPYWSTVPLELLPREFRVFGGVIQPELLVVSGETMFTLDRFLADQSGLVPARVWWQATAADDIATADDLSRLASGVAAIERDASDPTSRLGAALQGDQVRVATPIVEINGEVARAVERIEPAIAPVRVTGALLGLAVIGLGASFVARRRTVELRTWGIAGRSGITLGAVAGLGTAPAAVAGGLAGAVAGPLLVRWLGPSEVLHTASIPVLPVAAMTACGLVIVAGVTAAAAPRLVAERPPPRWIGLAGEAALHLLAVVLLAQLVRRDPARADPGTLDLATVLAPVVGAAALVTLGGRGIGALARRARRSGGRLPAGLFLAWRRVAASISQRIGVILPIAAAAGVALFSSLLVASVDDGLEAKATAAVGSEVAADLARTAVPAAVPEGMSLIWTGSATRTAASRVMLMVIDTESYRHAARWDDGFGLALDDLVARLDTAADRVPVAVTGRRADLLPGEGSVRTQSFDLAYRSVAELDAMPGMSDFLPTMVVSRQVLWDWALAFPELSSFIPPADTEVDPSVAPDVSGIEAARAPLTGEGVDRLLLGLTPRLVSTRSVAEVETFLARSGQPTTRITTRADVLADADLMAQRWAFDYLGVLALSALVLSVAVLGFAMIESQRRRVIAGALTRRMGAGRSVAAAALGAEVVALVTAALLLGIGAGWMLAAAFLDRFDPLPTFPPGLSPVTPASAFGLVALVAAAGAGGIWLAAQRAAARSDPAEVLRD